ncbi:unnamed protein product [Vicia faba]|uniref:Uncharacterized protein n=1 Tax=Vicia faba TaxID=3906 RepID=A0AAV1A4L2_VICFA|nr:unnamed protein product [Vicia faba]
MSLPLIREQKRTAPPVSSSPRVAPSSSTVQPIISLLPIQISLASVTFRSHLSCDSGFSATLNRSVKHVGLLAMIRKMKKRKPKRRFHRGLVVDDEGYDEDDVERRREVKTEDFSGEFFCSSSLRFSMNNRLVDIKAIGKQRQKENTKMI